MRISDWSSDVCSSDLLALYRNPPAQQEGVANDLRLLLQPVAAERFARHDVVSIAAEGMAHQRQIPTAAPLRMPYMGHLMDEMSLDGQRDVATIGAETADFRLEP